MKKIYVGRVINDVQGDYVNYSRKPSDHQFSETVDNTDCYASEEFKSESFEKAKAWFEDRKSKLVPAYIMKGFCTKYYMGSVVELDIYTENEDGELEYYDSFDRAESVYIEEEEDNVDDDED